MICKSCQMKEAFPNATTMFKHILVCQKRPADVLLCLLFFVQILVAATEQDKEMQDARPASHSSRQTGRHSSAAVSVSSASSQRVVSLSSSNHVVQVAGYQKKKKKGCKNTVVYKMIPEDHDKTNNFLQASPCPSRLTGCSILRQGGRISHGGFGVSLFEHLNMNGW